MQTPISQKIPVEIVSIENAIFVLTGFQGPEKKRGRGCSQCLQQPAVTPFTAFPGSTARGGHAFPETPVAHRSAPAILPYRATPDGPQAGNLGTAWPHLHCTAPARSGRNPSKCMGILFYQHKNMLPLYELQHNIYKEAIQCLSQIYHMTS